MSVLMILVPLALMLGGFFVWLFIWGLNRGEFDDLESPKHRMMSDQDDT